MIDPDRVAREAALLADRSDISEELVRANSHPLSRADSLPASCDAGGFRCCRKEVGSTVPLFVVIPEEAQVGFVGQVRRLDREIGSFLRPHRRGAAQQKPGSRVVLVDERSKLRTQMRWQVREKPGRRTNPGGDSEK